MCILCHTDSLRLLVAPLHSLGHFDLAESIRIAREAAMQIVFDTVDALSDVGAAETSLTAVGPDGYIEYVVERAERDGVARPIEVRRWVAAAQDQSILQDPRVQAFLSSAAEGLASYTMHLEDHRAMLARFLEVAPGSLVFAGLGSSGELSFDYGDERYITLSDEEAMQIAVDRITANLWQEDPTRLLQYTNLPDAAVDVLSAAQQRPQDEANDVLSGMVDVQALAEDVVRQRGYGPLVTEGGAHDFVEQRFGDRLIIRLPRPDDSDIEE